MRKINELFERLFLALTQIQNEERNLMRFLSSLKLTPDKKILEVGCGYGNKVKMFNSFGFKTVGVDINPQIVNEVRKSGLECFTIEEFKETTDRYDVLLMSHIVEHFRPDDLLRFIDAYLVRLKPGGYLIIATPLYSPYFYDDFDHVKPYHPIGINMVFNGKVAQVQYYSRNKIELIDIWFRKGPFRLVFSRGLYLRKYSKIPMLINLGLAILFRLSFGLIGRTDGWMGLYRKI